MQKKSWQKQDNVIIYNHQEKVKKKKEKTKMMEQLMDRMIALYGFENELTIQFCELCEKNVFSYDTLALLVEAHEQYPMY